MACTCHLVLVNISGPILPADVCPMVRLCDLISGCLCGPADGGLRLKGGADGLLFQPAGQGRGLKVRPTVRVAAELGGRQVDRGAAS